MGMGKFRPPEAPKPLNGFRYNLGYITMSGGHTPDIVIYPKFFAYYQNYCIGSNQILHSDKDHQTPFVGGPKTRITNPRWRTAAIL